MKVTIIRLSRPLLLPSEKTENGYNFKTIYGYVIKRPIKEDVLKKAEDYAGYLAAMHLYYNGNEGKDFTIDNEFRGVPDWADKKGVTHTTFDAWMGRICYNAIDRLKLTYTIIPIDLDDETYSTSINNWGLVVDEAFYYAIEKDSLYDTPCGEGSSDDDELPF